MRTKFLAILFTLAITLVTITACGSQTPTGSVPASDNFVESSGEGPVQGGIKSDEEIAALEEEAKQYESDEAPINVDMEGHEPIESGNFQNYWRGDDYFDFIGYMTENGYDKIRLVDINGEIFKDPDQQEFLYYDCKNSSISNWRVYVDAYGGALQLRSYDYDLWYYVYSNEGDKLVTIDNNGATMYENAIVTLDLVVQILKTDAANNDNPLAGTDLNYHLME